MKKYSLAISLPMYRNLSQNAALDRLLSDKRAVSYSRFVEEQEERARTSEKYVINYIIS